MSYVAECEQCGVLERGDLEAAGDAAEDHEQFHDVRVKRVATDGGSRLRCASCRATVTLDDTLELQAPEISDGTIARARVCEDCRPDTGNKRPVTAYKDLLKTVIKRANGVEEEQATLNENEWNPETADLRNGETTDVDSHAQRNAEQLRMGEKDPGDDDVVTDGGQDVRSEWSLVCTDCDWKDELVTEGHPRDGPPSEVEGRVREHKGTVDWSHVVRVEGRVADEDQEIDPSLLTDGGVPAGRYRHQCVDAVRTHTGVGDQYNTCVNDTPGCPGPDAGSKEFPCSACFLRGGEADD